MPVPRSHWRSAARWQAAFGHPTRLVLLRALARGPSDVASLGEGQPRGVYTASQHLKALRGVGLVRAERRAQHMVYALVGAEATAEGLVFRHDSGVKAILRLGEGA